MKELRADTIADRKQEQQEKHRLQRFGYRYVELPDKHADEQHRGHGTQREGFVLQLSDPEPYAYRQEDRDGRVGTHGFDNPVHNSIGLVSLLMNL